MVKQSQAVLVVPAHLWDDGVSETSWPGISVSTDHSLYSHQISDVTLDAHATYASFMLFSASYVREYATAPVQVMPPTAPLTSVKTLWFIQICLNIIHLHKLGHIYSHRYHHHSLLSETWLSTSSITIKHHKYITE